MCVLQRCSAFVPARIPRWVAVEITISWPTLDGNFALVAVPACLPPGDRPCLPLCFCVLLSFSCVVLVALLGALALRKTGKHVPVALNQFCTHRENEKLKMVCVLRSFCPSFSNLPTALRKLCAKMGVVQIIFTEVRSTLCALVGLTVISKL